MHISRILFGGRQVVDPVKWRATVKRNRRKNQARVRRVENFLRNYEMKRWGSTRNYILRVEAKQRQLEQLSAQDSDN